MTLKSKLQIGIDPQGYKTKSDSEKWRNPEI